MTIEKLLQCSAAELEAMSDEQLRKYFEPNYIKVRPELQPPPSEKCEKSSSYANTKSSKKYLAEQILFEALGRKIKL